MKDCRGELLLLVRNGLASPQEQAAFEGHLHSCDDCRLTLGLMGDFDQWGKVEPGDWERVARMAANTAALRGIPQRKVIKVGRRIWPLAIASLVITGAAIAGAAFHLSQYPNTKKTDAGIGAQRPSTQRSGLLASSPRSEPMPEPSAESALVARNEQAAEPVEIPQGRGPVPVDDTTTLPAATASDLYRTANDARRTGQTAPAIQIYQVLQRKFPGSIEAHASRVSLGGLLLRNGSTNAALTQFEAYLSAGGGRLAAEALFGRAQTLRTLGRSTDEVQALQLLVSQFPSSAYATHAKHRLKELR